jgi:SAM-dependent methyltransferase
VQWISTRLLVDLWRIVFGADARASFVGLDRIGLWESPTGLYFFDPPREGNQEFYMQFYQRVKRFLFTTERAEFLIAAKRIPSGANVLDVGCGRGDFQQRVPKANYTGLDPHFAEGSPIENVRNETLGQHLLRHAGSYDAVCCFQVLEHVCDPKSLFAEIVRAAKPGGLIFVGVPHVPSALTRIPNFLVNAPPHHLTWWTRMALMELASGAGAHVECVENVPWRAADALLYWIERCSPIKCREVHYQGSVKWHAAVLVGHFLGILMYRLTGAPEKTSDEGAGLLLIARRRLSDQGC